MSDDCGVTTMPRQRDLVFAIAPVVPDLPTPSLEQFIADARVIGERIRERRES